MSSPGSRAVAPPPDPGLLSLYDRALPEVYGYLLARCGQRALAEARHKLVDHWRRREREERRLRLVEGDAGVDDPWDIQLDALRAQQVLDRLSPQHRAALTLRYLDALPAPQVAALLQRTVHATEALLARARSDFRRAYVTTGGSDD